jgi:methyltransferase (TIGR00027 family)
MRSMVDDPHKTGPSRTALMAACARAAHLFHHGPRAVLADWLAWPLVGSEAEGLLAGLQSALGDVSVPIAAWMAGRSRISEDWLAACGAEQYVILGAGLDSYAWRQPPQADVFEVDHPETQSWKRSRLQALGIPAPAHLRWTPVNFEVESLAGGLARAGLRPASTFASWLGVTTYLERDAIAATLRELPPCSLAVTYAPPSETWEGEVRRASTIVESMARDASEPWISRLTASEFAHLLADNGFSILEDVGAEDLEDRYAVPALSIGNERLVLARKDGHA